MSFGTQWTHTLEFKQESSDFNTRSKATEHLAFKTRHYIEQNIHCSQNNNWHRDGQEVLESINIFQCIGLGSLYEGDGVQPQNRTILDNLQTK